MTDNDNIKSFQEEASKRVIENEYSPSTEWTAAQMFQHALHVSKTLPEYNSAVVWMFSEDGEYKVLSAGEIVDTNLLMLMEVEKLRILLTAMAGVEDD